MILYVQTTLSTQYQSVMDGRTDGLIRGSWFNPRQRRIGRHDSTSSSCPPHKPRLTWCPFSGVLLDDSLPVLSRSAWQGRFQGWSRGRALHSNLWPPVAPNEVLHVDILAVVYAIASLGLQVQVCQQSTGAVWCSGNALVLINAVALHRARLVLGWVTAFGYINYLTT